MVIKHVLFLGNMVDDDDHDDDDELLGFMQGLAILYSALRDSWVSDISTANGSTTDRQPSTFLILFTSFDMLEAIVMIILHPKTVGFSWISSED